MKQSRVMIKKNTTSIGNLGEDLVTKQLVADGFGIVARNYKPKIAEIDIIAIRSNNVHFVEVKSVTHETFAAYESHVSHETYRPEELVDAKKLRKLGQGIEIWLLETGFTGNFQLDIAVAHMIPREKWSKITMIECVSGE